MENSLTLQIIVAVLLFIGIGLSIGKYQYEQNLKHKEEKDLKE